jgi:hypothetical protein
MVLASYPAFQSVKLSRQRHTSARSLRPHAVPGQDQSCSIQDLTSCRSTTDYENLQLMAPVSERPGPMSCCRGQGEACDGIPG